MSVKLAIIAENAATDAIAGLLNGGFIDIYNGTRPATPNTAITTQTLLARLTFGTPAFAAASSGSAVAHAITADSDNNASGTATWCRWRTSAEAAVLDGTVATSGGDLNLSSTTITIHGTTTVGAVSLTTPVSC